MSEKANKVSGKGEKTRKPKDPNAPKKPKLPKVSIKLADAAKNELRFVAKQQPNGQVVSYASHIVRNEAGKRATSTKGASSVHANMDEAKAKLHEGVQAATAIGWSARPTRSAKDSFDLSSLPAPKQAAK